MQKKGFTIVELLAAVIVLVVIASIIASAVVSIIGRSRDQAFSQMVNNIENVSRIYVSNNKENIADINIEGSDIYVTLQDLVDDGIIKAPVLDPKTGEEIPLTTRILVHVLARNKYYVFFEYGDADRLSNFAQPKNIILTPGVITSKSIEVIGSAESKYGMIEEYQFSKDNGVNWTSYQASNSYVFNNLATGTYQLKLRVKNSYGVEGESEALAQSTTGITVPTYSIDTTDWALSKVVTVDYKTQNYTRQYSTNGGGTWNDSSTQTQDVTFNNNGSIIARVTDGVNTVTTSSYNVTKIDITNPTNPSIAKNVYYFSVTGGTDSESGVDRTTYALSGATSSSEQVYSGNVTITNIGTTTLTAKTYDNVENYSSSSNNIIVSASTCPSGFTKNGTTCERTQTATTNYSCPSGYSPVSGDETQCYRTQTATANYSCPSGYTLSGTTCTDSISAYENWNCNSGWYESGCSGSNPSCDCYRTQSATQVYYCPSGGTLSGTTCTIDGGTYQVYSTFYQEWACAWAGGDDYVWTIDHNWYCSGNCNDDCSVSGGELGHSYNNFISSNNQPSGSCSNPGLYITEWNNNPITESWEGTCNHLDTTYAASWYYSCPSGWNLSGSTCYDWDSSQAYFSNYYCPSGYSLSGSTCYDEIDATFNGYSCPSGWTLDGSTCYEYVAANVSYSCPSGWSLSGTTCYDETTPICTTGTYVSTYDKCYE